MKSSSAGLDFLFRRWLSLNFLFSFHFTLLLPFSSGSYCGQSAIPFSFEVRSNGQPVLGCARPACFGWTRDGQRAGDAAQFYRVWGRPDGFVRVADLQPPVANGDQQVSQSTKANDLDDEQIAHCDRTYGRQHCPADSWLGGIAPSIDNNEPLELLCCAYTSLAHSVPVSRVPIWVGQVLQGGEVLDEQGHESGEFEYIANVQRVAGAGGGVDDGDQRRPAYIVEVRKFACASGRPNGGTVSNSQTDAENGDEHQEQQDVQEDIIKNAAATPAEKEDEKAVLADFSEYEQQQQQQQDGEEELRISQQPSPPSSISHVHVGKRRFGEAIAQQKQQKAGRPSAIDNNQQQLHTGQEESMSKQQQQQPAVSQNAEGQQLPNALLQPRQQPSASAAHAIQQKKQQSSPILISPFGGYQMSATPQQPQQARSQPSMLWPAAQPNNFTPLNGNQPTNSLPSPLLDNFLPGGLGSSSSSSPAAAVWADGQRQPLAAAQQHQQQQRLWRRPPLLKIPSPEEIENAIPPHGRQLLNNLARTFLGMQRLF